MCRVYIGQIYATYDIARTTRRWPSTLFCLLHVANNQGETKGKTLVTDQLLHRAGSNCINQLLKRHANRLIEIEQDESVNQSAMPKRGP